MNAEQIAAQLTEPQKRAVLWLPANGEWRDHRRRSKNDGVSSTSLYCLKQRTIGDPAKRAAITYSLVEYKFDGGAKENGEIWPNSIFRLTPLGKAVRAILQEQTP